MAFRDLVDGDCAGPSSLIRLTSHLMQDRGYQEEGISNQRSFPAQHESALADQFVNQFLDETVNSAPQTFKMDNILREMQKMECNPRQEALTQERLGELGQDTAWASQYLASGRHFDVKKIYSIPAAVKKSLFFSSH